MPEAKPAMPPRSVSFLGAMALGLRSMFTRPWIAIVFLGATFVQGTLQGLLIWTLRHVLESLGTRGAQSGKLLLLNAGLIFAIWLLRSLSVFAAETLSVYLSH